MPLVSLVTGHNPSATKYSNTHESTTEKQKSLGKNNRYTIRYDALYSLLIETQHNKYWYLR